MNRNRNNSTRIALTCLLTSAWCAATALASVTLTHIPLNPWAPYGAGSWTANEGRGLSPDGRYVAGVCNADEYAGFLYDVTSRAVRQPASGGAVPSLLAGIAYRTDTNQVPAQTQLILDGKSSGYQTDWMTADGGLTWGAQRRNTSFTEGTVYPVANSLGAATGSDTFYTIVRNSSQQDAYTLRGAGLWDAATAPSLTCISNGVSSPDTLAMNAVAASGRAVGYRQIGGIRNQLCDRLSALLRHRFPL